MYDIYKYIFQYNFHATSPPLAATHLFSNHHFFDRPRPDRCRIRRKDPSLRPSERKNVGPRRGGRGDSRSHQQQQRGVCGVDLFRAAHGLPAL